MKKYPFLILIVAFIFSCKKEEDVTEKFIGVWQTTGNCLQNDTINSSISKGKEDRQINWAIQNEEFVLEISEGKYDSIANQTNLSIPFFADNSVNMTYKNHDTIVVNRNLGSIIILNYKICNYTLVRKS